MSKNSQFVVVDHTELVHSENAFLERFGGRVIGQPSALKIAQLAYNMVRNPLRDRTRPVGIFFLVGPSRTGKSLTGVALAEIFHNDPDALTRIQASDYTEDHQLLELKGAPPSYVGYRDPKDPKNKLQEHEVDPYSVISPHNLHRARLGSSERVDIVVIEEFEKSSPDFYKFWMGVFDKGTARLGNGMEADFRNTIFILTSNLGMDRLEREQRGSIGFVHRDEKTSVVDVESVVAEEMRRVYKPEFRNRLDAVVVFRPLDENSIIEIVDAEIALVQTRINEDMPAGKDFVLEVSTEAKRFMAASVDNNVAELKRVINRDLLMPLGRLLNSGKLNGGDIVRVTLKEGDSSLVFAVAKGAYGVAAHELELSKLGGNRALEGNLSLQREVRKLTAKAAEQAKKDWYVTISGESMKEMSVAGTELLNTLDNVLKLKVRNVSFQREAPFVFGVIVQATSEQINLLCRLHAEDDLGVNPAPSAEQVKPRK